MKKKKVLIDVNSVVPYYVTGRLTGIGRTTMELVKALDGLGDLPIEIALFSQNMKGVGASSLQTKFKTHHLYLPHREKWDKVIAHTPIREWMTGYDLMHIPHNFEHVHNPENCVVTLHDALFMKIQEREFSHEKMCVDVPPFIKRCRHIITCSDSSKKDIVELIGVEEQKVHVIPWGVRHDLFYPCKGSDTDLRNQLFTMGVFRPYFMSVSCNAERKRTHSLVDAYLDYLDDSQTRYDLVLAWNNPPRWLIEEVKVRNAESRVHFISNVSDDELRLLYQGAAASFMPSLYEGFGLPILEAMACGTVPVTCRNSSLPEVGGDVALYIDEPIKESIIEVMQKFDNETIDILDIQVRGIERALQYNWERTAIATVSLYQQLLMKA